MFAYSNNGHSFRAIDDDNPAIAGEVVFDDYATPEQLETAFPDFNKPEAPARVTARQFRMQLRNSGLRNVVVAWVAAQDPLVQDSFEYSGTFARSEPMMAAGFAALGFSPAQVDEFFMAAAAL